MERCIKQWLVLLGVWIALAPVFGSSVVLASTVELRACNPENLGRWRRVMRAYEQLDPGLEILRIFGHHDLLIQGQRLESNELRALIRLARRQAETMNVACLAINNASTGGPLLPGEVRCQTLPGFRFVFLLGPGDEQVVACERRFVQSFSGPYSFCATFGNVLSAALASANQDAYDFLGPDLSTETLIQMQNPLTQLRLTELSRDFCEAQLGDLDILDF